MKSPYVNEIEPNQTVHTTFLVQSKEIRQKKSGDPYLSLSLADRTGELDAKMWDNVAEVMETFGRDDFVKVKGQLQIFNNRPQLTIHRMQRVSDEEVEFADYFPASTRDPGEMLAELRQVMAGLGNPHLRALLETIFDDAEIARRFKTAPAAKNIHHAYLGGLIEHVLSLCKLSRLVGGHYPQVDLDLLITGAILHDIGKIYELNYERGFSYSAEGQLLGHLMIGLRLVGDKLQGLPEFPPRLRTLVEHMIISHHGHLEFGSPKVPQFPEAILLHYLDDLDSKMECTRAIVERDTLVDGEFTAYQASLERSLLKKEKYLQGPVPEPPPAPAAPVRTPAPTAAPAEGREGSRPLSPFAEKLANATRRPPGSNGA